MRLFWFAALATMLAATSADACATLAEIDLHDIKYADIVVIGRVANYEIVADPIIRQRYRDMFARHPELRKTFGEPDGFMTDYARFDILVGEVLRGEAPTRLTVTWDNSTFGEPDHMAPGPFLIALRDPKSPIPPLHGPSATIVPNQAAALLTVLEAPCAGPFMFDSASVQADRVRQILDEAAACRSHKHDRVFLAPCHADQFR